MRCEVYWNLERETHGAKLRARIRSDLRLVVIYFKSGAFNDVAELSFDLGHLNFRVPKVCLTEIPREHL